ncbi:3-mercaptopyruvate sulfurtransferase [Martelella sp. AD-3]|uniref:3-mercaptopyruvate sulfurtransferase n=1 Tax=Martelella sp. AD-3 TaxID=686597 RepID=UPI0004675FB0|nr:3-mercaptopyruvate sulfurtransferase [Martelella sp. AD-3]AMM87264.1 3-mercaptopyruvate sulfurtransferase [Martelella sp. AD-3]
MTFASSSLVSTEWLAKHLHNENIVILDGSFKLPGATPLASEDYEARHIPGAVFFDIDAIADHSTTLPHMLPSSDAFARSVEALGVSNDSFVVVYDTPGLMSAGRVWWTFRIFGHSNVAVLDGGLRAWLAEGRPVTSERTNVKAGRFTAKLNRSGVVSKSDVLKNVETRERPLVDARSAARFGATEQEARPGLRSGHIPGSLNVPFNLMTDPDTGRMKSPKKIRSVFEQAGFAMSRPAIASCGSGVTACALVFGLHLAGKDDVAVYDGAWAEWGIPGDTPVEPCP